VAKRHGHHGHRDSGGQRDADRAAAVGLQEAVGADGSGTKETSAKVPRNSAASFCGVLYTGISRFKREEQTVGF